MIHELFASLEAMLSVEAMNALEGRTVAHVDVEEWTPTADTAASGCAFLKVRSRAASGSRHYVVKRTAFETDIVRRLTDDVACRERLLWQHGVLDRLPPEVVCPTVACASDGNGCALLMYEVRDWLRRSTTWPAPGWQPVSLAQFSVVIGGLASLHARFFCDSSLCDPVLGLCTSAQFFTAFSPQVMSRHADSPHALLPRVQRGWGLLDTLDARCRGRLARVARESNTARECARAISGDTRARRSETRECRFPRPTHGANRLAVGERTAAGLDLAWLLQSFALVVTASKETIIANYRQQLAARLGARFDESTWEPQLRLALLGQCLRTMGMWLSEAHHAPTATARDMRRAQLPWWCEQARARSQMAIKAPLSDPIIRRS
jgi:hypothetical protein